ncbi:MAG TPA: CPCC family cysteine-rich protein [Verrucomicrobiae bacterium]|nr:CPCC family cysteine-rich protein [Verrucomicrobiae bacterium]
MNSNSSFPCPVCGYLVFNEPPGSYAICPICFWEDDEVHLGFPLMSGGANSVSLHEAQQHFVRVGACEQRFTSHVRQPTASDQRDPKWRPFDPTLDPHLKWNSEADSKRRLEAGQGVCLYYWLLPKKAG